MTSIIEACRRSRNDWPSGQRRGYGNANRLLGVTAFCLSGRNNVRVRAPMAAWPQGTGARAVGQKQLSVFRQAATASHCGPRQDWLW
jgi:hypothetical protein